MLEVVNLAKSFGGRTLFRDVSLRLDPGDRIGLVGPNGVGKTTLLRIVTGEEHAEDGSIRRPRDLSVGYLPQDIARASGDSVLGHTLAAAGAVLQLEAQITALEAQLASGEGDVSALSQRHIELIERHRFLEGHTLEARAREILAGLGFSEAQLAAPLDTLSGGWGMRVELGRILLTRPDVLLLDEPTNHLDMKSLLWLEDFLADYPGAWLVVSHDRYFLNRMVTSVAELSPDGLWVFGGNYDDYLEGRAELEEQLAREQAMAAKRIAETKAFIERFRAKASKARQAQSRVKLLTKLEGDMVARAEAAPRQKPTRKLKMTLPEPARSGDLVLSLKEVRKAYGDHVVYDGISLQLRRGERVALVGDNGAGKTTLLKMLAGILAPDAGQVLLGHNVETYYFAQHQAEALEVRNTVLAEMRALLPLESETRVRGLLGAFLFSGDDVDKRIAVLSGGEKSRLALAKMLARPANLLLLDEPTNHLDLASRDIVESALSGFGGTVCFISHDRYFINRVATKVIEVRAGGKVTEYPGDYDYYLWKSSLSGGASGESGDEVDPAAATGARGAEPASDERSARANEREARKTAQREATKKAKEVARLESEIERAEARMHAIDTSLSDPLVYADAQRCRDLTAERRDLESRLPPLYEQWEQMAGA